MNARKKKPQASPEETPEVVEAGRTPEPNDLEETAGATDGEIVETRPQTAEDWREKYLRVLAELDNFRKRSERERDQTRQYAAEGLVRDLLPVLDALEMAKASEGDADSLRKGVKLAVDDALRVLKERGVEAIETDGENFEGIRRLLLEWKQNVVQDVEDQVIGGRTVTIVNDPILVRADKWTEWHYVGEIMKQCSQPDIAFWKVQLALSDQDKETGIKNERIK